MIEIRSFRRVFDLERRIYRVDSFRLNPAGVPVRGVLYFLAALVAAQLLVALPGLGRLLAVVPWYVRSLGLPLAVALLLGLIRVEGRNFHLAAMSLGRFALDRRARRLRPVPGTWRPSELQFLPDGSDADMRELRYTGPGMLVVRAPHRRELRRVRGRVHQWAVAPRTELVLTPAPGARRRVAIEVGSRRRVRTRRALPRARR
jgi:hypothetical protein